MAQARPMPREMPVIKTVVDINKYLEDNANTDYTYDFKDVKGQQKAKKALEMSLGRGGDQAAVYTENGYVYFGGMANLANETSRVSPRQTSANIATLIKKYKKAIVVGHKFSDYDAIGSAMGICFFAQANGLQSFIAVDENNQLRAVVIGGKIVEDDM